MKKIAIIAIACALLFIGVAKFSAREYSRTEYMLDTVVTIKANKKTAVNKCFEEIERLENLFSAYKEGSDIYNINSSPYGTAVLVSDETAELIKKAMEYKKLTGGAFDISIKPVTDLWNIKGGGYVPTEEELGKALSLLGDVDIKERTVTLTKEGMKLDLGGIAKGYIGDKVRDILESYNVRYALVNLGGNIVTVGDNKGRKWQVGVQSPTEPSGTILGHVEVIDKSVVTSGGYERYFEKDGKVYHHIIDTSTGKNPENNILGVTVVSEDGVFADALATATFILGKDKGMEIAASHNAEMVVCTEEGVFSTEGSTFCQYYISR